MSAEIGERDGRNCEAMVRGCCYAEWGVKDQEKYDSCLWKRKNTWSLDLKIFNFFLAL